MRSLAGLMTAFGLALVSLLGLGLANRADQGERLQAPSYRVNSVGMQLSRIPAGMFLMGSAETEAHRLPNEGPVHEVRISEPFWLGRHEVTRGEFARFVNETGYQTESERDAEGGFGVDFETARVKRIRGLNWRDPRFPGFTPTPEHPVVLVSWRDAEAFCEWLSRREGRRYRLPTEAEWEFAARGSSRTRYSFGDEADELWRFANVADRSLFHAVDAVDWGEEWTDGYPFTAPVGSFAPNAFGLQDMHGNVWEWCEDWHADDYYAASPLRDPTGPPTGRFRVIRGGGWLNPARQNRSAQRVYFDPEFRYCLLSGFRVLMEASN